MYDWNYQLYYSGAGRKIRTDEFRNFMIMKLADKEAGVNKNYGQSIYPGNKILYLKRTYINCVRTSAQQEVDVLIEESGNARNIIIVKNHLFVTNSSTEAPVEYRYRINNSHKAMVLNYKTRML